MKKSIKIDWEDTWWEPLAFGLQSNLQITDKLQSRMQIQVSLVVGCHDIITLPDTIYSIPHSSQF